MKRLPPWLAAVAICLLLGTTPLLDSQTSATSWLIWGYVCGFVLVVAVLAWASQHAPDQPEEPQTNLPTVVDLATRREQLNRKARGAQGPLP